MTDSKLEEVMDKMDAHGPGVLSAFEHQGIYGDVEEFREANPEWKIGTEDFDSDEVDADASEMNTDIIDDAENSIDNAEKIKKIKELYDEDILTKEEFEKKKQEFLDEM